MLLEMVLDQLLATDANDRLTDQVLVRRVRPVKARVLRVRLRSGTPQLFALLSCLIVAVPYETRPSPPADCISEILISKPAVLIQ